MVCLGCCARYDGFGVSAVIGVGCYLILLCEGSVDYRCSKRCVGEVC